jgi:hypothetical protein
MEKQKMYRQGDILFIETEYLPDNLYQLNHLIIAEGEATGHMHQIIGNTAILLEPEERTNDWNTVENDRNKIKFLKVLSDSDVIHNEHHPITLPEGNYKIIQQREYVPGQRRGRYVID